MVNISKVFEDAQNSSECEFDSLVDNSEDKNFDINNNQLGCEQSSLTVIKDTQCDIQLTQISVKPTNPERHETDICISAINKDIKDLTEREKIQMSQYNISFNHNREARRAIAEVRYNLFILLHEL